MKRHQPYECSRRFLWSREVKLNTSSPPRHIPSRLLWQNGGSTGHRVPVVLRPLGMWQFAMELVGEVAWNTYGLVTQRISRIWGAPYQFVEFKRKKCHFLLCKGLYHFENAERILTSVKRTLCKHAVWCLWFTKGRFVNLNFTHIQVHSHRRLILGARC